MDINQRRAGWLSIALLVIGSAATAQLRVPRLVSDGMVLQRDMPIRLWGFGSPGEQVTVKFDGESASGVTDDNGRWMVVLAPRKPGGPYTMDIDGINHIWLKDILVGDVWLCAGGYSMRQTIGDQQAKYAELIAGADKAPVRQYRVATHYDYTGPRQNLSTGKWETADAASVLSFSELAYLFALQVYEHYHVPVGLINVSVADAPAEAWLSPEGLRMFPQYAGSAGRYADSSFPAGSRPADRKATGGLFNGMIAPVDPYTVRGVLWSQAKSEAGEAKTYRELFSGLVEDWRLQWRAGALPWIFTQFGSQGAPVQEPVESQLAELRNAQRLTLAVPVTAMAAAADLGERNDGDIANKEELARRMFQAAEHAAYQKENIIYTGPLFHNMRVRQGKVSIGFDDVESGLVVKGGRELGGFALAGPDNHFYWAKAVIEGKKVVVTCGQVPNPVAVRYGWADNPDRANLINRDHLFQDGLPAPAFEARKGQK